MELSRVFGQTFTQGTILSICYREGPSEASDKDCCADYWIVDTPSHIKEKKLVITVVCLNRESHISDLSCF